MKIKVVAIIGVILSLVILFITANNIENGDINAISMYLIVFLIPVSILAVLNAFYVRFINKFTKTVSKIIFSFIPIVILAFLSSQKNLTMPIIDGDLSFLATISTLAIGITNLIWVISLATKSSTNK